MNVTHHIQRVREFLRDESGVALVEFSIMLPMLLLLFAVIIEGGRLMWSYNAVNSGVRDATRYLARIAPSNICNSGGSVVGYTTKLETIVRRTHTGSNIFPSGITVDSVTPSLSCIAGTYRVSPAPVARVTATLTVTFPFSNVFTFAGQSFGTVTTTIFDESRVFGA